MVRQHKSLPVQEISDLQEMGKTKTGSVFEQQIQIIDADGSSLQLRRIVIQLHQSTRHGDRERRIVRRI